MFKLRYFVLTSQGHYFYLNKTKRR